MPITEREDLLNILEPQSLIEAFMNYPPKGFEPDYIKAGSHDIYGFWAKFDVLTSANGSLKAISDRIRKFRVIDYLFTNVFAIPTLFVGTAVSEYSLFPRGMELRKFRLALQHQLNKSGKNLIIIKDIPSDSPLLSEQENSSSKALIHYLEKNDFIVLTGQALAYIPITFDSMEGYLSKFDSKRRNDLKRKIKSQLEVKKEILDTGSNFFNENNVRLIYSLYLDAYNRSDAKFEKLTLDFFRQVLQHDTNGKVFVYSVEGRVIGFALFYVFNYYLIDKCHGALYPDSLKFNLFEKHLLDGIEYSINAGLKTFVIGETAAETKAAFGCDFTYTDHVIYVKNPILRFVFQRFSQYFSPMGSI